MRTRWRKWEWDENEDEMNVTQQGPEEGNAKEEGKRKHQHNLAQSRQTLKGKGKRKAEDDGKTDKDQRRGGEDGRAWTNLPRRNLNLPKHARTQTYLERGARMKLGTNGD